MCIRDSSYYEEEALNRGLSVEQLKSMKKLERDNESMRRALEDQQRRENAERVYAGWVKQAEDVKTIYPAFDLQEECRNDQFVSCLLYTSAGGETRCGGRPGSTPTENER